MREKTLWILALIAALFIAGCGAAQVAVTVENHSSAPVRNVEINYVSASFGIPELAPGAAFHKKVEPLRSGNLQMKYVTQSGKELQSPGPAIEQGKSAVAVCEIADDGVHWSLR